MKKVYALETLADDAIETAIGTVMEAPYHSPEPEGVFQMWPKVITRADAKKILVRRMVSKNRRGRTGGPL